MPKEVVDFIQSQFLSVLSLEMPDGSPHGATVHFAYDGNSKLFLFETYNTHLKAKPLLSKKETRASLVIGFGEKERKTLQIDGVARLLKDDNEEILFHKIYFKKFPNKKSQDKNFIFFVVEPRWWRFTNWDAPGGKLVLTSEDK